MTQKINEKVLGYSLAIVSALFMLLLGIAGYLGVYTGAVNAMAQWHILFSITPLGIIGGMIEAAFWSFIAGWLIGYFYNKCS